MNPADRQSKELFWFGKSVDSMGEAALREAVYKLAIMLDDEREAHARSLRAWDMARARRKRLSPATFFQWLRGDAVTLR